jgi:hypothetical protein
MAWLLNFTACWTQKFTPKFLWFRRKRNKALVEPRKTIKLATYSQTKAHGERDKNGHQERELSPWRSQLQKPPCQLSILTRTLHRCIMTRRNSFFSRRQGENSWTENHNLRAKAVFSRKKSILPP